MAFIDSVVFLSSYLAVCSSWRGKRARCLLLGVGVGMRSGDGAEGGRGKERESAMVEIDWREEKC